MKEVVVTTKDELEKAVKDGVDTIIVQGKLVDNIKRIKSLRNKSKIMLWTLGAIATSIPTGGVSIPIAYLAATSTAALTGTEIALILAIALLGMSLILQIMDKYDVDGEVEIKGVVKIKLKKKQS